nr:MAG TPA: hypothetical protein [Caudoviricetes sp.]
MRIVISATLARSASCCWVSPFEIRSASRISGNGTVHHLTCAGSPGHSERTALLPPGRTEQARKSPSRAYLFLWETAHHRIRQDNRRKRRRGQRFFRTPQRWANAGTSPTASRTRRRHQAHHQAPQRKAPLACVAPKGGKQIFLAKTL